MARNSFGGSCNVNKSELGAKPNSLSLLAYLHIYPVELGGDTDKRLQHLRIEMLRRCPPVSLCQDPAGFGVVFFQLLKPARKKPKKKGTWRDAKFPFVFIFAMCRLFETFGELVERTAPTGLAIPHRIRRNTGMLQGHYRLSAIHFERHGHQ